MKQLQKLAFTPGINREGTNYSAEGFWFDCDRVRFRNGLPETIGGWMPYISTPVQGIVRAMKSWTALDGTDLLAIGTSQKVYLESGQGLYDITPLRTTFSGMSNPFTVYAQNNPLKIIVTFPTPHGAVINDTFTVTGATLGVNGVPIAGFNGTHRVSQVLSDLTLSYTMGYAAVSTGTGGGTGITITFQIGSGSDTASLGTGWGIGPYGRGGYGTPYLINASAYGQIRTWSMQNYGEDLIMAPYGGAPYYWTRSNGLNTGAVNLSTLGGATDVPQIVGLILVTNERHVVAFGASNAGGGAYDPMLIRWASQEQPSVWTPTVTNTAGDYRLSAGDHIEAAIPSHDEILVFTDTTLYSMSYIGTPYIFDVKQIGDRITIAGPNAVISVGNTAYWMGNNRFYMYTGVIQPIPCSVQRHVFGDFNRNQARQVSVGHIEEFSEIWWFYCSGSATLPDKYVVYNYVQQIWYIGNIGRTAWTQLTGTHQLLAAGTDGVLYVHEFGVVDGSTTPVSPLNSYIETSDFDLQDGTSFYFVESLIPDVRFDRSTTVTPEVHFTLKARDFPGENTQNAEDRQIQRTASVPIDVYTTQAWVRLRGRQLALRISCDADDAATAWQLGFPRISVRTDGRR